MDFAKSPSPCGFVFGYRGEDALCNVEGMNGLPNEEISVVVADALLQGRARTTELSALPLGISIPLSMPCNITLAILRDGCRHTAV